MVLSNITPGNYSISNCSRENRSSGGLALVYKKFLDLIQAHKGAKSSFEFAKWHLKYKGQSTMVVGVYRTPYFRNHPVTEEVFLNEFADFLKNIVMFNGKLIILGDFNLQVNDRENSSGSRFLDLLESVGLVNHQRLHCQSWFVFTLENREIVSRVAEVCTEIVFPSIKDHRKPESQFFKFCVLA